jgi:indole-3-glycerol phosphate synthase
MRDFLEQIIAERRADAMTSERRILEVDLVRDARDNVWTKATKEGTVVDQLVAVSRSWAEPTFPIQYGDAFTFALQARRAQGHLAVIAEVKRVSPALGVIEADADATTLARGYAAAGATAISVLTEPRHWGGSIADLAAVRDALPAMPLLCKDVIVHRQQIVEARAAGADAVLLIAEALTDQELRELIAHARTMNMGVLLEAHEPIAFGRAAALRTSVIGINARNLRRPTEIDIGRARQLQGFAQPGQILVAESGISTVGDARLLPARVDAVLIGTALMRASDPKPLISGIASIRKSTSSPPVGSAPSR